MRNQTFSQQVVVLRTVAVATAAALFISSCGSDGVPAGTGASADDSPAEGVAEGGGEMVANAQSAPDDGERAIVMTMDNGDVWEFSGECLLEEVNDFDIENTFTIDGSHPDGDELVLVRGGFNTEVPVESGFIEFAEFGFFQSVNGTLEATVVGDTLEASSEFSSPRGTEGDKYGLGFSATFSC